MGHGPLNKPWEKWNLLPFLCFKLFQDVLHFCLFFYFYLKSFKWTTRCFPDVNMSIQTTTIWVGKSVRTHCCCRDLFVQILMVQRHASWVHPFGSVVLSRPRALLRRQQPFPQSTVDISESLSNPSKQHSCLGKKTTKYYLTVPSKQSPFLCCTSLQQWEVR